MREPWIFYTAAGGNNFVFLGAHIYTFFTQPAADEKKFGFFGVKMVPYILHTHFLHSPPQAKKIGVFGCKMVPYIHILDFFGVEMLPYIHIWVFFLGHNATICTHFGFFFGSKCCHIYTFLEFNFSRKNEKKKNNTRREKNLGPFFFRN